GFQLEQADRGMARGRLPRRSFHRRQGSGKRQVHGCEVAEVASDEPDTARACGRHPLWPFAALSGRIGTASRLPWPYFMERERRSTMTSRKWILAAAAAAGVATLAGCA